jgi:hypothetical protein
LNGHVSETADTDNDNCASRVELRQRRLHGILLIADAITLET